MAVLTGTNGNDTLNGGAADDQISGLGGDDTLSGGAGTDTIIGGLGNDTLDGGAADNDVASYAAASGSITVNLALGTATGADGNDTLVNIERVFGSNFADTLIGDGNNNLLRGNRGNDTLDGGVGNDDDADYGGATGGVTVNLLTGTSSGADGIDTLNNIENVRGSNFADLLTGNASNNDLRGNLGNDTIDGGAGFDFAVYRNATGGVTVSLATGKSSGPDGVDTLISIENLRGTDFGDTLIGDASNNVLQGELGNDTLNGGAGIDRAEYGNATAAVEVNLTTGKSAGADGVDTLIAIENIDGSLFDDTLTGNASANFLFGDDGNDLLVGGLGDDTLSGDVGSDTADYSGAAGSVTVNLTAGTATGAHGSDTLISIERVRGSNSADDLTGNASANRLRGNGGDDRLDGGTGTDRAEYNNATGSVTVSLGSNTSSGADGNDTLISIEEVRGSNFDDTLTGNDGNNLLIGERGDDNLTGGAGTDLAEYGNATGGVTVSLASGLSSGADGNDTLDGIENVDGSIFEDTLIGDENANVLFGDAGADRLIGGLGNDTLDGSSSVGGDTADYSGASGSVTVDLIAGTASGADGSDTLISIENIRGSHFADSLTGNASNNVLRGNQGNDALNGGTGTDTADYSQATGAVSVNLAAGTGSGADGSDTLSSIENIRGGTSDDSLTGDANTNILAGERGNDTLDGGGGGDTAEYINATGSVTVSLATNTSSGADGNDTLISIENIRGGDFADTLTGDTNNNTLRGNEGNDTINGGAGSDTASYASASAGVTASLVTNTSSGADGADTLISIENLHGSDSADILTGDANNNVLRGNEGNDILNGGAGTDSAEYSDASGGVAVSLATNSSSGADGNDTLNSIENIRGSNFADILTGDAFDNTLRGNLGDDVLMGGAGRDTADYSQATGSVTVNLGAGKVSGADGNDTLVSIENVTGTASNETFVGGDLTHARDSLGNAITESFRPLGGDDTITGEAGNGFITRVDYSSNTDAQAVTVNLGTGTASDGFGGTDTLVRVDRAFGGAGDDTLRGGSHERTGSGTFFELFRGNAGNDIIDGVGTDILVGAAGNDRVNYDNSTAAVNVNLATGTASDGFGFTDTLLNIDSVEGSAFNDTLTGGHVNDTLIGNAGNDLLVGVVNGVEASYQTSTAGVTASLVTGKASDGFGGTDTLTNIDDLRGSEFNDRLTGNAESNRLNGDAGADIIDGGAGIDFASYSGGQLVNGGIDAFIQNGSGTVADGYGSTDTLTNIEGLIGTQTGDTLSGGTGNQVFVGRGGSDFIIGGAGSDTASYIDDPAGVTASLLEGKATDGWGGIWALDSSTLSINSEPRAIASHVVDASNPLVGSWVLDDPTENVVVTFLSDGTYLIAEDSEEDLTGHDGMERGTYTWNPVTGAFNTVTTVDTSGDFGLSHANIESVVLEGNELTATDPGEGEVYTLTRVAADDVPLVGGWYIANEGEAQSTAVVTFLADGTYFMAEDGDSVLDPSGQDGMEFGTYTWNADTGAFTFTTLVDTTGEWGLSHGDVESITISDTDILIGIENIEGSNFADTLTGDAGNNILTGLAGDDTLEGGGGNDTLDGGTGADAMEGGDGNDNYVADNVGDTVTESNAAAAGGIDLVQSGVDFTLGANVENLTLTGGDSTDATGNALNNILLGNAGDNVLTGAEGSDTLTGNAGDDTLDGGTGKDALSGGLGDDTYTVDGASAATYDTVTEATGVGTGDDTVLFGGSGTYVLGANVENLTLLDTAGDANATGNAAVNTLTGNSGDNVLEGDAGNDTLTGGDGDDTLNGGAGNDTMTGGAGDDTYTVDSAGDDVTEEEGEGEDTVNASFNFTLGGNIENLNLLGAAALNGTGDGGDNVITGNSGANVLLGAGGNDTLEGGAGNDTLNGGPGDDDMTGGDGSDTYVVDSVDDTVTETNAAAAGGVDLVQSAGDFTLGANLENLTLTGGDSTDGTGNALNNIILGNSGNNVLTGAEGNDTLTGNAGNDTLDGGTGKDALSGGAGDDTYTVDGVSAATYDTVTEAAGAGSGNDTVLFGGSGTYVLGANLENLTLQDDAGDANATGNALANTLTGNIGDNVLDGGAGIDTFAGGAGDDTYVLDNVAELDFANEDPDEGSDTVRILFSNASATPRVVDLVGSDFENVTVLGTGLFDLTGNERDNILIGNASINDIIGNEGNDTLTGNAGNDTLTGGEGDDTLNGGAGNDTMTGGSGNDIYTVDSAGDVVNEEDGEGDNDTVNASFNFTLGGNIENLNLLGTAALNGTGDDGDNVITGNSGANVLLGAGGNDTLEGGAGNDTLNGGAGDDEMEGGDGSDTYVVDSAGDTVTESNGLAAGGIDLVQSGVDFSLGANLENLTLTGTEDLEGTGNTLNNIILGNAGDNVLTGAEGNDTLTGNAGDDSLDGGTGKDALSGGAGDDTYTVDGVSAATYDTVTEATGAGSGNDTVLFGGSGTYVLAANVEAVELQEAADDANATGNALVNTLTGNSGNNVLNGLAGIDTFEGGAGDDTYVLDNATELNFVTENADEGSDTLRLTFAQVGAARLIDLSAGQPLENFENVEVLGTGLFNLTGNDRDNILIGNASINLISGEAGDDTLSGLAGNDTLIGGEGDDALNGGVGNDTMVGGLGDDTYTVDSAGDVVNEVEGEGDADTVLASFTFSLVGGFVENLTLLSTAVNASATGNDLANILTGNASANALTGGGGDDTLTGGAGNDTLNGGEGDDDMTGGDGNDTYAVDSAGDTVTETNAAAIGGIDLVNSSVDFTLGANVEKLTLIGDAINGTGNSLDNAIVGNAGANVLTGAAGIDTLTGNAGNDRLNGGTGKDSLAGGLGDDTYTVDGVSAVTYDTVTEAAGAGSGNDTVEFEGSGTYVLGANVENLTLQAAAGDAKGTGNALANILIGNSGNNVLDGKAGADTLTGDTGADDFVFSTAAVAGNIDTVTDFGNGADTLRFNNAIFTALGPDGDLNPAAFNSGAGFTQGQDASDRLIYDTETGNLYYDANGSAAGGSVQVATLTGIPALTASDIILI